MGLVDAFGAEDRVQVKFSDFYKLMKQAAQYEIAMNAIGYHGSGRGFSRKKNVAITTASTGAGLPVLMAVM